MKNFILALAVAGSVLCACNKELVPERQVQSDTMEIGINSFNGTKGYVVSELFADTPYNTLHPHADADIETSARQMIVSSFLSPQDGTPGTYFKNADFRRSASDGLWHNFKNDAVAPIYWPLGGSLSFLALSVTNSLAEGQLVWNEENVAESFTLDAGDNFHQDDILFASISGRKVGVAPTVDMTFSHAQAWIEFQLTSSLADIVTIRKIELLDVYSKGKVTVYNNSGDAFAQWNFRNEKKANLRMDDIYNVCSAPLKEKGDDSTIGYMDMLIPEQPKTGFIVTYSFKGKPDELEFRHDLEHENWLMGNKYIYALDFDVNEITVDPSVTPFNVIPNEIALRPVADAEYHISAQSGDKKTLPLATISSGTKMTIDWGDGTVEEHQYGDVTGTKAEMTAEKENISLSHIYRKPFTGSVRLFIEEGSVHLTAGEGDIDNIEIKNEDKVSAEATDYLEFVGRGPQTVAFVMKGNQDMLGHNFEYSYDLNEWIEWDCTDISFGDDEHSRIFIRGNNPEGINIDNNFNVGTFTFGNSTAPVDCFGNIMTLISPNGTEQTIPRLYCFYRIFYNQSVITSSPRLPATSLKACCYEQMFYKCASLVNAPELPATTLAEECYDGMFYECTSLVNAPKNLPATTLVEDCYRDMFEGCSSLTNAPELPATTLAEECYKSMFRGCTSLVNAPELPATTLSRLSRKCYFNMFDGCTSLVNAPKLPATTLVEECYESMFSGCTSLVNAPELPATNLVDYCYSSMFKGCSSLVNAPELPATELKYSCYKEMFSGCTSLVNAPELPATKLNNYCYKEMFSGCASLVNAPELPATNLDGSYYTGMFSGCGNLSKISVGAYTVSSSSYLTDWLKNVNSSGTIYVPSNATWAVAGTNGIPSGWTVNNDYKNFPTVTYNTNAEAGSTLTLTPMRISDGTKGSVIWGDSTSEDFSEASADAGILNMEHTYSSAFSGNVKICVEKGSVEFIDLSDEEYKNFIVIDKSKASLIINGFTFTINSSGDFVKFSSGNLYWDGNKFAFEENQYDSPASWDENHIGQFYWSKDVNVALSQSYNDDNTTFNDTFFASDGRAIKGYTTLSKSEWDYLFQHAYSIPSTPVNINGIDCIILHPDGFEGAVSGKYTAAEWAEAETEYGLVALPFSYIRTDSTLSEKDKWGQNCFYWAGDSPNSVQAYLFRRSSNNKVTTTLDYRTSGYSVRLVKKFLK